MVTARGPVGGGVMRAYGLPVPLRLKDARVLTSRRATVIMPARADEPIDARAGKPIRHRQIHTPRSERRSLSAALMLNANASGDRLGAGVALKRGIPRRQAKIYLTRHGERYVSIPVSSYHECVLI
jgi:hypothetical protein